jgi:acyl carrier protein
MAKGQLKPMSHREPEQALRALLTEISGKDLGGTGLDEDLVRELGLDSLAALRMLAAVEKRFEVRFPDDRLTEFRTLRRLLEVLAPVAPEGPP